ncbi:unnamed protein product [Ambrosiozyma monospora]|uniref:Unnamed protein product n=1 Tax=Ambrosiozyma monospora TaxID=43982 RepID=A0ACB5T7T0_AMBMO|nr:unnamed protein product [Ambrosiozyma monospora]
MSSAVTHTVKKTDNETAVDSRSVSGTGHELPDRTVTSSVTKSRVDDEDEEHLDRILLMVNLQFSLLI